MTRINADIEEVLRRDHLPVLDGVRAIAVMVVIADHAQAVPAIGRWRLFNGGMGVSGFFVLSGFLITWLLLREHEKTGRISLRDFYIRRVLRIWPAYFVLLALSYVLRGFLHPTEPAGPMSPTLLSAATFTFNYFKAFGLESHLEIAQLWTVSLEEQFYLLWPMVLIVLLRKGREWALKVMVVTIVLVLAWRCLLYFGLGVGWNYIFHAFDTRLDNLAIGCLLALAPTTPGFIRLAKAVASSPLLPLLPLSVLVVNANVWYGYQWTLAPTIEAACMLLLIVQFLQLYRHRLWSWLQHPITRYIGLVSYSVYLYQYFGMTVAVNLRPGLGPWSMFLIGGGATILFASVSYYVIERPFLRLRRRFTPPRGSESNPRTAPSAGLPTHLAGK